MTIDIELELQDDTSHDQDDIFTEFRYIQLLCN